MITTIFAIWFFVSLAVNLVGVIRYLPEIILTILLLPIAPFVVARRTYKEGRTKLAITLFVLSIICYVSWALIFIADAYWS